MTARTVRPQRKPAETAKIIANFEQQNKLRAAAEENRRNLWHGLNHFISRNGGFLISPPYSKQLLIEVPQFCDLPDKLADLGYTLHPAHTGTRIIGGVFTPVQAYQFTIPTVK